MKTSNQTITLQNCNLSDQTDIATVSQVMITSYSMVLRVSVRNSRFGHTQHYALQYSRGRLQAGSGVPLLVRDICQIAIDRIELMQLCPAAMADQLSSFA